LVHLFEILDSNSSKTLITYKCKIFTPKTPKQVQNLKTRIVLARPQTSSKYRLLFSQTTFSRKVLESYLLRVFKNKIQNQRKQLCFLVVLDNLYSKTLQVVVRLKLVAVQLIQIYLLGLCSKNMFNH
jgi:hypothetical protein